MADSLVLTGKKTVTKHTGTEMVRLDDKRGGNTWQLPRWWVIGGNGTVYVASTVFKVTVGAASGYLAVASTSESTRMKIVHNGNFTFDFQYLNEVSRAALYDADMQLVEHYVFPKISGGKTMVVTPPNAAPRPASGPTQTLTSVTLSGDDTASDGETKIYTATSAGTATDVSYVLTSSEAGDSISNLNIEFNGTGERTLTLTGTSVNAQTNKSDTLTVTVS